MDFNARMSQQFRSQNLNGGRVKQQQNDSDAFMRLVRKQTQRVLVGSSADESPSRIVKLRDVSVILGFSSLRKIYKNQIRNRSKRSLNGLLNC